MTGKGDVQATLAQYYAEWVRTTCEIAQAYAYQARLDDALVLLDSDAVRLVEAEMAPRDRVRLQVQRAGVLRYKGWLNNDHGCYDAALTILSDVEETASCLADLGLQAYIVDLTGVLSYSKELGRSALEAAQEHFERGLALRRESGAPRDIAASLLHLGWVSQHRAGADEADARKAFELFQEAYRLAEHEDDPLLRAEAARHMADMHRRRGELDQALAKHLEYVTLCEGVGCRLCLPPGYTMAGVSCLMLGDLDRALDYCERAHALAREIGAGVFTAEALYGIGAVVQAKGDPHGALGTYQRALAAAQATDFGWVITLASRKVEGLSQGKPAEGYR